MTTSPHYLWAEQELRSAALPDQRLNRRLIRLVADLAARPESSVPQACAAWSATKAAYRFFSNGRVLPDDILDPHRRATVQRLPAQGPILALQDTTTFDFTSQPATTGLGYLGDLKHQGLLVHSVLLADAEGVPLGLLDQQVWTRDPADFGKRKRRRRKETADKESQRWLDACKRTQELLPAGRTVITVADREADFYDLFAASRPQGHHLLIRAKGRRRIRHEGRLLLPALRQSPPRGRLEVAVPRANGRPERTAVLTIRFGQYDIEPPSTHPRRKELQPLPLGAVWAEEEQPPPGAKAIRWLLLTTLPVTTPAEAIELVGYYSRRWLAERLHFVEKSGCKIEALQLGTAERLRRALATYAIVAWRLLWLTYEARQHPEVPCTRALDNLEWEVLHRQVHPEQPLPTQPPSLREGVRQLARLGGFLARAGDGEPGVKVLWRGLRRLQDLVRGYQLAREQEGSPPRLVGNG